MKNIILKVNELNKTVRLDNFLVANIEKFSRTYLQSIIQKKLVKINGQLAIKPGIKVKNSDIIEIQFPEFIPPKIEQLNHALTIDILYENNNFLIIHKPSNLIMHKATSTSTTITLVDWLINNYGYIKDVGALDRPGIVHRLDKDTTGLLIIPKNNYAHAQFSKMFKDRKIEKTYFAIVHGHPEESGIIDYPITRDTVQKHKMTHKHAYGRDSITKYNVIKYLKEITLLEVLPLTGRTHQIRVHASAIGHPLVGDTVYGTKSENINRQALHAYKLSFFFEDRLYTFWWDMPEDMKKIILQ